MRRLLTIILTVTLMWGGLVSQVLPSHMYFTHKDSDTGLSQNTVRTILQDKKGFIWIGTHQGINRYDGVEFRRFPELNTNIINTIYESEAGNLWIGTDEGVMLYLPEEEAFLSLQSVTKNKRYLTSEVHLIKSIPGSEDILIGPEGGGLYIFRQDSRNLEPIEGTHDGKLANVRDVVYDTHGNVWIATFGRGLYRTTPNYREINKFVDNQGMDVTEDAIVTDLALLDDWLYVATDTRGLWRINTMTDESEQIFETDGGRHLPYIRTIMPNTSSELWIGTEEGLYVLNLNTRRRDYYSHDYNDPHSLSDNAIYSIMKDRDGGIWLGTYFGGVNYYPSHGDVFEKYYAGRKGYGETGERVREILRDDSGRLWIATEDAGLSWLDADGNMFHRFTADNSFSNVQSIMIADNKLWVGTFANGIRIIDLSTGAVRPITIQSGKGLASNYVFCIAKDASGNIYIGTMSGLQQYNPSTDTFVTTGELRDKFVYDILEDSHHNLWVGTYSNGLYVKRGGSGKWQHYTAGIGEGNLPSNMIYGLYEDMEHRLWVMTQKGLCSYNYATDSFETSKIQQHLSDDIVYQILEDNMGSYWLTTNNGLVMMDPTMSKSTRYTVSNGLPSNQFNYASGYRDEDGTIWFGGVTGLISFRPEPSRGMTVPPAPVVTGIKVNGKSLMPGEGKELEKSITLSKEVRLGSDVKSIDLSLATLSYDSRSELALRYRLIGESDEWTETPLKDGIKFSELSYGNHKLEVAAYDTRTGAQSSVTTLDINIHRPFLISVWAFIIYAVILGFLGFFIYRTIRKREREKTSLKMEAMRVEQERKDQENRILFFTNIAHEIRTPLTLIKVPLENVFASKQVKADAEAIENLDVINLNVDRLLQLVNQLLDFRKMEAGKFKIHAQKCDIVALVEGILERFMPTIKKAGMKLSVTMPEHSIEAAVDREAITKIMSNLLTNAIKYGESRIEVSLRSDDSNFTVVVSNDGHIVEQSKREEIFSPFTRFDAGNLPGTGIGLSYARSLARMHNATLMMDEDQSRNTFILSVPLDLEATGQDEEAEGDSTAVEQREDLEQLLNRGSKHIVSILLVEDNPELSAMIVKRLTTHGYRMLSVGNGKEALEVMSKEHIDLIISDIMMPEMDGYELLKTVREDVNYSHIPFIFLTAKTDLHDKLEGLQLGADSYIEKPFSMEYLVANVSTILRGKERIRARAAELPPVGEKVLNPVDEKFISKLNGIIKENYMDPEFSMDHVFEQMGMSHTSFYRKVKGLLNLPPGEYIRMYRLRKATELFESGHTNVAEVSVMVGFSSASYFTKCFQKQYGKTPKAYMEGIGGK